MAESQQGDAPLPGVRRRGAIALLALVAVLVTAVIAIGFAPKGQPVNGILPYDPTGFAAPAITLPTLAGKQITLSSLKGRPIVVNFWASWCAPCADEAATLGRGERKWRAKGVVFIGVDSKDTDADARTFLRRYRIDYDSFIDHAGTQTRRWGVTGYPETLFIDRSGRIVSKYISVISTDALDSRVRALLPN